MFLRRLSFSFILFLLCGVAIAQIPGLEEEEGSEEQVRQGSSILDDSTKQIYGPLTTSFTFEKNIKYNLPETLKIDTSIYNFHRFQYIARERNTYQNLGNIGTAISPIYPQQSTVIGATDGRTVYDLYASDPSEVKYYNTRSPYSRFGIIWGGRGRSITEANFTRNVTPLSNFFFNYKGLFIDKQIDRTGRGDRHALRTYYDLGGNYGSKDGKYLALAHFMRNNHIVDEYGGVANASGPDDIQYFNDNRTGILSEVETQELRTNYHFYNEYRWKPGLQPYYSYDRFKKQSDYLSSSLNESAFGQVVVDVQPVKDRTRIITRTHELGAKGDLGKSFYNFYYKARDVFFLYRYISPDWTDIETNFLENYIGTNLRFGNDSLSYIEAYGELLLDNAFDDTNYKLGGKIKNSWFNASGSIVKSQPSFLAQAYIATHDVWRNDFTSPTTVQLETGLDFKYGGLHIYPSIRYNLFNNYIYFRKLEDDENLRPIPIQSSSDISLIRANLNFDLNFFKNFHFGNELVLATVEGSSKDAMQLPDILWNGQLYYENISFEGNLHWQFGFEMNWKSAYFANAYDPALLQFYVQDEFEIPSYPLVDVFANMRINRVRLFLKYNNLYRIFNDTGYFTTPFYPGQDHILDFGIDWAFYN